MSSTPNLVISNTSPLLYLHQIGCLSILQMLYNQVVVPQAVQLELLVGQQQGVDGPEISQYEWLHLQSVATVASMPNVIDLGPGEAEAKLFEPGIGRRIDCHAIPANAPHTEAAVSEAATDRQGLSAR
jgi:hypothetical protein